MFYGVILEDGTNLCIPACWMYAIDVVRAFNSGLNSNKKRRIFFSKDLNRSPNFLLPIRNMFHENEDACYLARTTRSFWNLAECINHMEKLRGGLPPVYNEMRNRENPAAFIEEQIVVDREIELRRNIKLEVKIEVDKQIFPLRNTVIVLNKLLPVCDLTLDERDAIDLTISDDECQNRSDMKTVDEICVVDDLTKDSPSVISNTNTLRTFKISGK